MFYFSVDCKWFPFGDWSECSVTCGGGERIAKRAVIEHALYGGKECEGSETKVEVCNEDPCPGIMN